MALWAVVQFGGLDANGVRMDIGDSNDPSIRAAIAANDDPVVPPPTDTGTSTDNGGQQSGATAMAEGASGDKNAPHITASRQVANNDRPPQLSREQQLELARTSGIFGSEYLETGIKTISGGDEDISSGFDKVTMWGGQFGPAGDAFGTGVGRFGVGPGGGCTVACGGIGTGRYHTIGDGPGTGPYGNGPGGGGPGMRPHHGALPPVISRPTAVGGLDREIIHRYVKREQDKIGYCYEKQLIAKPGLEGDVVVNFVIMPNGTVSGASGAGLDSEVAQCVAGVIGNIAFPAPSDNGTVQVKYPFHFHAAGK